METRLERRKDTTKRQSSDKFFMLSTSLNIEQRVIKCHITENQGEYIDVKYEKEL